MGGFISRKLIAGRFWFVFTRSSITTAPKEKQLISSRTFSSLASQTFPAILGRLSARLLFVGVLTTASSLITTAQESTDYNRVEVYGGYSLGRVKSTISSLSFTDPSGQTST